MARHSSDGMIRRNGSQKAKSMSAEDSNPAPEAAQNPAQNPASEPDAIWLAVSKPQLARSLSQAIAKDLDVPIIMGPQRGEAGNIGLVIADDNAGACLQEARRYAADNQFSIHVSKSKPARPTAHFMVSALNDQSALLSLIQAVWTYRDHVRSLAGDLHRRFACVGAMMSGEFSIRSEAEARDIAVMLALACPEPHRVAAGLQILLVNALELGSLEMDPKVRAERQLKGTHRADVARRREDEAYAGRDIRLKVMRSDRLISFIIQDDGAGLEEDELELQTSGLRGDRAPGLALAEELGFAQVRHLGIGATIEATLTLG